MTQFCSFLNSENPDSDCDIVKKVGLAIAFIMKPLVIPIQATKSNLYETDFVEWAFEQALALSQHDLKNLDWDHLKEEIENLGREQINAVNSLLKQVIIHRLKLDYLQDEINRSHWESEINTFVDQIEDRLTATLINKLDLPKIYARSRRDVLKQYPKLNIPEYCPYNLDSLLVIFD